LLSITLFFNYLSLPHNLWSVRDLTVNQNGYLEYLVHISTKNNWYWIFIADCK
jgi:hypothetical protein